MGVVHLSLSPLARIKSRGGSLYGHFLLLHKRVDLYWLFIDLIADIDGPDPAHQEVWYQDHLYQSQDQVVDKLVAAALILHAPPGCHYTCYYGAHAGQNYIQCQYYASKARRDRDNGIRCHVHLNFNDWVCLLSIFNLLVCALTDTLFSKDLLKWLVWMVTMSVVVWMPCQISSFSNAFPLSLLSYLEYWFQSRCILSCAQLYVERAMKWRCWLSIRSNY